MTGPYQVRLLRLVFPEKQRVAELFTAALAEETFDLLGSSGYQRLVDSVWFVFLQGFFGKRVIYGLFLMKCSVKNICL